MSLMQAERWQATSARWRGVVVFVCILAIGFSLATRTTVPQPAAAGTKAQAQLDSPGHQHLDGDAEVWLPPVVLVLLLEPSSSYPRIAPASPPVLSVFFEDALSNRPPPSC